jgi:hypothetical protein
MVTDGTCGVCSITHTDVAEVSGLGLALLRGLGQSQGFRVAFGYPGESSDDATLFARIMSEG